MGARKFWKPWRNVPKKTATNGKNNHEYLLTRKELILFFIGNESAVI